MNERIVLKNLKIITESKTIMNGFVLIERGKIEGIGSMDEYLPSSDEHEWFFPDRCTVIPGMIDIHIHGAYGYDVMDATEEALTNMARQLPREGTTSFLATTITQKQDEIERAIENVARYKKKGTSKIGAEILGMHVEGPFISPLRAGAQSINYIQNPDIHLFNNWQSLSGQTIKVITMAPEEKDGIEFIQQVKKNGVIASIGHSDAKNGCIEKAIQAGAMHVTHLYNGMRGMHHREPGVVGMALGSDELFVELIVDGLHVHPLVVKNTWKIKRSEKIILITDAMRAKGLPDGEYDLGGQVVQVKDRKPLLPDGTLAGSILTMNQALKNMMSFTGCSLEDVVKMTSMNPAKQLHVFDRIGSIKVGKDADLVVLNEELDVIMTICKGQLAYKKQNYHECE